MVLHSVRSTAQRGGVDPYGSSGELMDYVIRFLAGGLVVSLFAVVGDVLRPKSFAGLFGAAPSVALATLTLTSWKEGGAYVAIDYRRNRTCGLQLSGPPAPHARALLRPRSDYGGSRRMACDCRWSAAGFAGVRDDRPRQILSTQGRSLVRIFRAFCSRRACNRFGRFGGEHLGGPPPAGYFWRFPLSSARALPSLKSMSASEKRSKGCRAKSAARTPRLSTQPARAWAAPH
jgi:hypothetical protein